MNFYERNLLDLEHYINELETWLVDAENNEAEMSDLAYIVAQINDVAVEFEAVRINLKTMLRYIDRAKEINL